MVPVDLAVLGSLLVDGEPAGLAHRDRVVLAALATRAGLPVPRDALADALWGEVVPGSAAKVIQGCVLRLRKVLGHAAIDTTPGGYVLRLHSDSLDTARFERLVAQARDRLGAGEPDRAEHLVGQALALWRGEPFAELEDWEPSRVEAQRLTQLRLDAQDVHTQAGLELGRHEEVLAEALSRAEEAPLRERRWELAALAQYRCGRQGDALATLTRAKILLAAELGLDPGPGLVALERAILSQDPGLLSAPHPGNASKACPYPGLLPFDLEDEATFYGREADVTACLDRLDHTGVLTVLGPSGCGKSSLVRAGVAAALRRDGRRVVVVTPGTRPLDSLSGVVSGRESRGVVLVVDQCEEGLAEEVDPREQAAWVDALVDHAARGHLVLALRSDRVGALAGYPTLSRLVEPGLYLLGAMGEAELRSAIEGPAAHAGLRLETGLIDLLVRDVRGEPGALPLLSHVLRQTWMRREGATLTVAGYQASGGVREAVAQTADSLYERLEPPQRAMLRDLMLRLVVVAPDGEPMRSRMRRSQVVPDPTREHLIEQLVAARLVSTDDQSVEIAHEALAREWPRLRAWLDEDSEGQQILRHLAVAADTWESMGRPDSELYRGVRLERALEWQTACAPALSPAEAQFLQVSRAVADADQQAAHRQALRDRRSNRRLRVLLTATATLAIVTAVLGSLAAASARRAEDQAVSADARRVGAEALTAPQADTSLLLAVAGMRLERNSDAARSNLAAALTRSPMLARVQRTPAAGSITVDPKDGRVALALSDGGLTVYDARTLRVLSQGKLGGAGYAAAFSPDGRVLAAADSPFDWGTPVRPEAVHLTDPSGAPYPLKVGGAPDSFRSVWSVTFSADSRRLAAPVVGDVFGPVHLVVWDMANPAKPIAVMQPGAYSSSVALSTDGRLLYATGDTLLRVFDVGTGKQLQQLTGAQLGLGPLPYRDLRWTPQVVMSPDGRTLAVSSRTEVALLDPVTLMSRARLPATGRITSIAFSADSRRLVVAGGGVTVWDLDPHRRIPLALAPQDDGHRPVQVFRSQAWDGDVAALSPDGNTVYAAGQQAQLLAWDLSGSTGWVTTRPAPPLPDVAVGAQVSPDGSRVAYQLNGGSRMAVRDVASGKLVVTQYSENVDALYAWLTWRPDGRAVTSATGNEYMIVRDSATAELVQRRAVAGNASTVAYTQDGRLAAGSDDGHLTVLDAHSLQWQAGPLEALVNGPVQALALDPARHAVAVEAQTGGVLVDYLSGRVLRKLPAWTFFAPDGTTSAIVDANGAVGFKTGEGKRWVSEPDPSHAYGDVMSTYSHNSAWFASSRAGQVGLWNARTGAFVGSVPVTGEVSLGFTPDDHALVIAGLDGAVQMWDLRPQVWIRTACSVAGRDLSLQEWSTILPGRTAQRVCVAVGR